LKPFNLGNLRHKITILTPPPANMDSDFGEPSDNWCTLATVYASKVPLLGRELYQAMTADNLVRVKFIMRYMSGIDETMRIEHEGKLYAIVSAQDVYSAGVEMVCYCKEIQKR